MSQVRYAARVGLQDDVNRVKAKQAEDEALRRAWQASGFTDRSPRVGPPPMEWKDLVAESLELLRFDQPAVIEKAPDGTLRTKSAGPRTITETTFFGNKRQRTVKGGATTAFARVLIGRQGKDCDNYSIWIFPDGQVAILKDDSEISDYDRKRIQEWHVDHVRAAIVKTISTYR